jgi:hypothetical protein
MGRALGCESLHLAMLAADDDLHGTLRLTSDTLQSLTLSGCSNYTTLLNSPRLDAVLPLVTLRLVALRWIDTHDLIASLQRVAATLRHLLIWNSCSPVRALAVDRKLVGDMDSVHIKGAAAANDFDEALCRQRLYSFISDDTVDCLPFAAGYPPHVRRRVNLASSSDGELTCPVVS